MKSIIQEDKNFCFLCGRNGNGDPLEEHHVFFGNPLRDRSDKDGLSVYLCGDRCHRNGKKAAHRCRETNRYLKRIAQKAWEKQKVSEGMTETEAREAFRERYKRSWL